MSWLLQRAGGPGRLCKRRYPGAVLTVPRRAADRDGRGPAARLREAAGHLRGRRTRSVSAAPPAKRLMAASGAGSGSQSCCRSAFIVSNRSVTVPIWSVSRSCNARTCCTDRSTVSCASRIWWPTTRSLKMLLKKMSANLKPAVSSSLGAVGSCRRLRPGRCAAPPAADRPRVPLARPGRSGRA